MTKKKTPAPRRAGTRVPNRAAREVTIADLFERWRREDPAKFAKAMRALARAETPDD